jgi:hypothetical protein
VRRVDQGGMLGLGVVDELCGRLDAADVERDRDDL